MYFGVQSSKAMKGVSRVGHRLRLRRPMDRHAGLSQAVSFPSSFLGVAFRADVGTLIFAVAS